MQKLTIMLRRILHATALSRAERVLALEALWALARARLILTLLPFPRAMARLGLHIGDRQDALPDTALPDTAIADSAVAGAVTVAVRRAARVAPFRAVCLQQAVAAAMLLHRRGQPVTVHFGVARDNAGFGAHAWTTSGAITVTGGSQSPLFTEIAVFTP